MSDSTSPAPGASSRGKSADLGADRAWLEGYRAGNRDALERVYRAYLPFVHALLCRGGTGARVQVFLDEQDRADIIQEVFVRALGAESRQRYDGLRPFSAFLRGVVEHVAINHLRGRGRGEAARQRLESMVQADPGQWTPGEPLQESELISREESQAVSEFMAGLPEEEQRFIHVRFVAAVSQRDAAEQLGLSRQRVRTLEEKLRARLREFLDARQL